MGDQRARTAVRRVKRSVKIIVVFVVFACIAGALNYVYVLPDYWYPIFWHNFYEDNGKIDRIYLGSSHVYSDINPSQLDEKNGQYNFNMSTPAQMLNGSLYLLKEADRENALSHVYLELYYYCSTKDFDHVDPVDLKQGYPSNWQNTDYMKNTLNKFQYMASIGDVESVPELIFPFIRYRSKLGDRDHIRKTLKVKQSDDYRSYRYSKDFEDGREEYYGQGYHFSTRQLTDEDRVFMQTRILDEDSLGEKSEKYLRRIITYCRDEEIPITLFVSPIDYLQLISTENYDSYITRIRGIAAEYGIEFYDFNLAKDEYLPIHNNMYFRDPGHLNAEGAGIFTSFFHEVMSGRPEENKEYFYETLREKLTKTESALYGLYYSESEGIMTYRIASNREGGWNTALPWSRKMESCMFCRILMKIRFLSCPRTIMGNVQ